MKKTSLVIALIGLILSTSYLKAQTSDKSDESDKCVGQGRFIFDAYYGYPYMFGRYVKQVIDEENTNGNNTSNASVKNLNHLGFKFEYMINKLVGLGLDYTYAQVSGKYTETNSVYQSGGNYTYQTNNYNVLLKKQRLLARINFHVGTSKFLDPYATAGLGYKISILSSDNPYDQQDVNDINNSIINTFPIAFRLGFGLRYFPTKNFGICAEAGIGGPVIQAGLCGKF